MNKILPFAFKSSEDIIALCSRMGEGISHLLDFLSQFYIYHVLHILERETLVPVSSNSLELSYPSCPFSFVLFQPGSASNCEMLALLVSFHLILATFLLVHFSLISGLWSTFMDLILTHSSCFKQPL